MKSSFLALAACAALASGAFAQGAAIDAKSFVKILKSYNKAGGAGFSVCVSRDGSTMVSSSIFQGGKVAESGSASVYEREGKAWTLRCVLLPPQSAKDDLFGFKTAVSANGSVVVVGAPGTGGPDSPASGSVFVYKRPAEGWAKSVGAAMTWEDPDPAPYRMFGGALATDNAGAQVVVGDWGANSNTGKVYVFGSEAESKLDEGVRSTEYSISTLGYGGAAPGDYFGSCVAISGDGDFIAASATGWKNFTGMVLLFRKSPNGWADAGMAKLAFPDNFSNYSSFGSKIALSENGTRLAICASGVINNISLASAGLFVLSFDWNSDNLLKQFVYLPSLFGGAIPGIFSLDISGDGRVIAASGTNNKAGNVALYACDNDTWKGKDLKTQKLKLPAGALALSGDGSILVAGDSTAKKGVGEYQSVTLGRDLSPIK